MAQLPCIGVSWPLTNRHLLPRRCGSGTHLGRAVLAGDIGLGNLRFLDSLHCLCRIGHGFQLLVHINYLLFFY